MILTTKPRHAFSIAANHKRARLLEILKEGPMYLPEISTRLCVGLTYSQSVVVSLVKAGLVIPDGTAAKHGRKDLNGRYVRYALPPTERSEPAVRGREFKPLKRDPFEHMKLCMLARK